MSGYTGFRALFAQEWRTLFTDKTIRTIMLVVPILYFTLFGFLYGAQKVVELPTVVVDGDHSALSRELVRAIEQDQSFRITEEVADEATALARVDAGQAAMALVIPPRLEADAKAGREAAVLTVIDGSNLMISNTAVRAASTDIKTVSAGLTLKKLSARGAWGDAGKNLYTGIDYRTRVLYNPTFSYQAFMLFGLGASVLQQVAFLGICLAVTREKEMGTWERTRAAHSFGWLVLGKLLPYWLVSSAVSMICFALSIKGFGIAAQGNPLPALVAALVFNAAVLCIGFLVSLKAPDSLQATQTAMLIAVPSFMLSGFTWPLASMPAPLAWLGQSLPLTYFLHAVREVLSKGHGFGSILGDLGVLGGMGALALAAAAWLLRSKARAAQPAVSESELAPSRT